MGSVNFSSGVIDIKWSTEISHNARKAERESREVCVRESDSLGKGL